MELTPIEAFSVEPIPDPAIEGRAWQARVVLIGVPSACLTIRASFMESDLLAPGEIEFSFFSDNDRWRLAILDEPRRVWRDLASEFRLHMWEGWRLLKKRHLELRRLV
jgi:hypothetical protein